VLFIEPRHGHSPDAELAGLVGDVAEAMARGVLRQGNTHTVALTIWAAVHGVAALAAAHPDTPRHVVDELADTAVDAVLIGLG
jgi:hypothetical protein